MKDFLYKKKIPKIISKNYYKLINTTLHIPNKKYGDDNKNRIKALRYKVNWIIVIIREKFSSSFNLGSDITIDESMILFKIHSKLIKCGFKVHCLDNTTTNYLYNFCFDPGKVTEQIIKYKDGIKYTENIV